MNEQERDDLLKRLDRGQEAQTRLLYELFALLERIADAPDLDPLLPLIAASSLGRDHFLAVELVGLPELTTAVVEATGPIDAGTAHRLGIFLSRRADKTAAGFRLLQVPNKRPALFKVVPCRRS